jgi:ribosomal protein S18 acetylase RimI-like enzyme
MIAPGAAERARTWRRESMAAVCDVIEPWEHGTVLRATAFPSYYAFNMVWVEGNPGLPAEELIAVADRGLSDLDHRLLEFERADAAEAVRGDLEAAGWVTTKLVWMLHTKPLPPGVAAQTEEVHYDAVRELRVAWHYEKFSRDLDPTDFLDSAREVAMSREVQVIATREGDELVGYAQLERIGRTAEIDQVYVSPAYRGGGRGTALTRAAIEAADDAEDLWIVADEVGRPRELYARLGFRPAWTSVEFLRLPEGVRPVVT